jgi:type IV pilus assembly protein PilC
MLFYRTRRLMIFYRELAQLVASGVPVIEAMGILSAQGGDLRLKGIAAGIKQYLEKSGSLGDAFSQFPDVFPALHINIIRYCETAGRFVEGLNSLADYLEKDYAMQQNIIVGLAYPLVLLHAAIFLLPIVNAATSGIGAYISGVLSLLIPLYGLVFLFYFLSQQRNEQFKTGFDNFLLQIPRIGGIVQQISLTRFIRAMQILSASGVSVVTGWRMAARACGNNVIRNALLDGLPLIEQGQTLSKAFIQARVFPASTIGMITAAEKSGSIVSTLNTIAVYFERENETQVAILVRILPVVFYLLIAGYIGFRIISFYSGYFNRVFSPTF